MIVWLFRMRQIAPCYHSEESGLLDILQYDAHLT